MPRDPRYNPTERIGRILEDVGELENYIQALQAMLQQVAEEAGISYIQPPAYPICEAIIQERAFRHRNLGQVMATRSAVRKKRLQDKPADMEALETGLTSKARADLQRLLDGD